MHFLTYDWQIITTWLHTHPNHAVIITFLVAFAESLAIIGTLVPGSITMTAIGILAGSGVMRIDLTFMAAILGAVAGDGVSYMIGSTFSERLVQIWPFRRYPRWIAYGKEYFARHGGNSVLIGRFFGPLRSIIPMIAGMLRMSRLHFFFANVISGIGWSILYLTPGVLIGAASTDLSAEDASQLFGIILLGLTLLWLCSLAIKKIFLRFRAWLKKQQD
jgi:membrane protein DedA with SNARE-associated domain